MKAKLSILALGAMALVSSCSNDQTVDINDGNAIKFGVTAGKSSRATENGIDALKNATTGGFNVWAIDGESKKYIDGAVVKYSNDAWTMDTKKFWPQNSLSFFALYPKDLPGVSVSKDASTLDYTANGQTDVLYATTLNVGRPAKAANVALNFYHALSQIVFQAKNDKPGDIEVVIKGIEIKQVYETGTFTWGKQDTEANNNNANAGEWTNHTTLKTYTAWTNAGTTLGADISTLENANLFLVPQTLTPWHNTTNNTWNDAGARVLVDCVIKDKGTGYQLWPKTTTNANTKVAISLPGTWLPGRKYTYTIVFGEGAGYDDTTVTPEDPTPDPVLVPISFEVSVSGFENGNGDNGEELSGKTN